MLKPLILGFLPALAFAADPLPPRQMERLGRGVVAIPAGDGKAFVSWRLLGTDPENIAFHLYRVVGDGEPVRVNRDPIAKATCFTDSATRRGQRAT